MKKQFSILLLLVALQCHAQFWTGSYYTNYMTFNAGGASNLPSANLTGTVPDARLSSNVPLLNAAQSFTGTSNNFTGQISMRSNLVFDVGAATSWTLSQRSFIGSIPVPTFRSTAAGTTSLDLMPNGSLTDAGYGKAWFDITTQDCMTNNPANVQSIHIASHSNFQEISSVDYTGGSPLSLVFGLGNGLTSGLTSYMRLTNSTVTVPVVGIFNVGWSIPTNYVSANFAPTAGQAKAVMSNNWLFIVTSFSTNPFVQTQP